MNTLSDLLYDIKMYLLDEFDVLLSRLMIYRLRAGYGADCETRDTDDFPELRDTPAARCGSCRAGEIIEWLEQHVDLIKSNS